MMIDFGLIITAALLIGATIVAIYTLSALRDWIGQRVGNLRNQQIIGGALKERLENNNYMVIPFVFDERNEMLIDVDRVETRKLDEELEQSFANNDSYISYST